MFTYDQIQKTEDIDLMDLGQGAINNQPQNKDWQEGYPEEWQYWEACASEPDYQDVKPGVLVYPDDQDKVDRLHEYCEGPMMNSVTELPESWGNQYRPFDSVSEAAAQLYDLPVCIVEFFERSMDYGLALTGGGMDLSWELCLAYIRLGHTPPLKFCDLPRMAGMDFSAPENKIVIEACKKSCKAHTGQINRLLSDLENFDV